MKINWTTYTVQDFIDNGEAELRTGPFGTQLHASDYVEKGTPVINVRNIGFGDIREENLEFILQQTVDRLSNHLLKKGDIVFGRKGAVERHAFIKERYSDWFQGSDCLRLRFSSPKVDPQFVSYSFLTERHKQWMKNQGSHGATMASLNQGIIARIPLTLPPLPIQRKIASILSAYDDLIENNTRRIQILEEMAQAIYREWFVHFRFPGHEGVRMVDSGTELGMIPEGWEVKRLCDLYHTGSGGTPRRNKPEYYNGEIPWLKTKELPDGYVLDTEECLTQLGLKNSSAKLYPRNTVVMAMYGATIGKLGILSKPSTTNQACCAILPRENSHFSHAYVYYYLYSNRQEIIKLGMGAAQQNISQVVIKGLKIIKPVEDIVIKYNQTINPLLEQIECLQIKDRNLIKQRNLLLPHLFSG